MTSSVGIHGAPTLVLGVQMNLALIGRFFVIVRLGAVGVHRARDRLCCDWGHGICDYAEDGGS